jgi:ADP-heptose:LPS heptosyltransferase
LTGGVLVARLDSDGDVLLAGPAIRAAAHGGGEVVLLAGPGGRQAAELLPAVSRVLTWRCPWIEPEPGSVTPAETGWLVDQVSALRPAVALILTSFHQSALPLALLLRLAGVPRIAAISTDYPGSLLDIRLRPGIDFDDDAPEPERALRVAEVAGFPLPTGDDGRLRVTTPPEVGALTGPPPYLVVHPGATVPARMWPPERAAELVALLAGRGKRVLVTGAAHERSLTARVAGSHGVDLGGRTSFAELAGVLAGAASMVVGNTGPAHLAAAVGTPVVSLFAPVVPANRWAPYRVPTVLLGNQDAPCRDSRARVCPVPGHPCLATVTAEQAAAAVESLAGVAV